MKVVPDILWNTNTFKYEALRAGSLKYETKIKYYDMLYKKLYRQAKNFEKSEFRDLELQQSLIGELKPRSQLEEGELDAKLARMAQIERNESLLVSELRREREAFYVDYEEALADRFYSDTERKTINPKTYSKFVNFVQMAHATHMGDWLYDSDQLTEFKNTIGKENFEAMDSDELYTEFYDYLEQQAEIARREVEWVSREGLTN